MNKPKLLIVDDVAENIHILSNILKDDFKIIATTSSKKALELAKKKPQPDLIVLDIVMPIMDGYDVCKILKKEIETQNIPVVFITSLNNDKDIEKGFACGASEFITKPIINTLVRKRLLNQLNFQNLNKEKQMQNRIKNTILVVDDVAQNIQVILEILKKDYNLIVANSGKKALEILKDKKPDLILLDILMPEIDGFEVCKEIKKNQKTKNIPIIFLTILENKNDMVKGLQLGAVDYVSKPVEPMVLKARIQTHLNLKHLQEKELYQKVKEEVAKNREKDKQKLLQSKLTQMGEMMSMIAHQWRQPLNAISTRCANLTIKSQLNKLNNELVLKEAMKIDEYSQNLSTTINDFRNFFKSNKEKEISNFTQLVKNVLTIIEISIINKNIKIIQNLNCEENFSTYQNELKQVILNLIKNSEDILLEKKIKDPFIKISSYYEKKQYILEISDNGGGIPENIKDKIFNPYFSTKMQKDGTGLGLYMSKTIVEEHCKGQLTVNNNQDGAVFKISLI